jgi:hypothetical protein
MSAPSEARAPAGNRIRTQPIDPPPAENESWPKVLVLRQDNPTLRFGSGDHVASRQPRLFFGNRGNVVTGRPQRPNHGTVAALIGGESRWSVP